MLSDEVLYCYHGCELTAKALTKIYIEEWTRNIHPHVYFGLDTLKCRMIVDRNPLACLAYKLNA